MPNLSAMPRLIGATVLALAALILLAAALPAMGQAAPPSSGYPVAATSTAFPRTTVGNSSEKLSVELTNVSGGTVYITGFGTEGADASDFTINEFPCWELTPGATCTVALYFSPQSVGAKEASMRLDLYQAGSESIELSGTGVPVELTFSPPSHDFGVQSTHENGRATFTLTNSGEAPAVFTNFEIPNPDGNVPFWINNNNCQMMTQVQPGSSCSLDVEFGPRDVTSYSGELRVRFQNTVFSAALSGEGGRPNVVATENPADLGTAPVGGVGPVRTITLVNSGNLPAGFFIGIVAGGDSGSFRLLDENCSAAELMPAATCTVHIRLAPESAGPKVARLAFFGDGDSGTMVMLHGEGVLSSATLAPGGFDFGSQAKGSKSSARNFVVANDGSTPVALGSAAIVGANLDQFLLAGDECAGVTLAPGQECLVRIRFAPATVGAKTATLRVASDAGAFTSSLSGLGVTPENSAGAADSRSGKGQGRFRHGTTINAARAHCRSGSACRKARIAKRGGAQGRAAR